MANKNKKQNEKKSIVPQEKNRKVENTLLKIGMIIVVMAVAVLIALLLFQLFLNDTTDDVITDPFEDYLQVTYSDLEVILVQEEYGAIASDDVRRAMVRNDDVRYFFFYHSQTPDSYKAYIEVFKNIDSITLNQPIFFVDLDRLDFQGFEGFDTILSISSFSSNGKPTLVLFRVDTENPIEYKKDPTVIKNILNTFETKSEEN